MNHFALAHAAHRSGGPTEAQKAYAAEQIERRGLRPIIDAVNAQCERAFGKPPEHNPAGMGD